MNVLTKFIPITKIDAVKRLVYGTATAELPDTSGEICDYESTKPLYEKWSDGISKATDGKSLGNVRVMHGPIAAGKLTTISFDDTAKSIEICAKVVDDTEWNKVQEGVYTGFSQGGKYVKRWKDPDDATLTRYTADPIEVSLVDLPCLPECAFQMIKADGTTEMRKFASVVPPVAAVEEPVISNAQVADKATELAKAAGDASKWPDFIAPARDALVKAAAPVAAPVAKVAEPVAPAAVAEPTNFDPEVEQVWKSVDGKTYAKKAEALKANADFRAAEAVKAVAAPTMAILADITTALDKRDGKTPETPAAEATAQPAEAVVAKVAKVHRIVTVAALGKAVKPAEKQDAVNKGLYDVARLAGLILELQWLNEGVTWEAEIEADGSAVPGAMKQQIADLCGVLRAMVEEETAELIGDDDTIEIFEMAAGHLPHGHIDALVKMADKLGKAKDEVLKAGARHGKADKARLDGAHDLLVDAGASCGGMADKSATAGDLVKITGERDALTKALADLQPTLTDILKRVTNIEAQPAQGTPTVFKLVSKEGDVDGSIAKSLEGLTPDQLSTLAIKLAQQHGKPLSERGR